MHEYRAREWGSADESTVEESFPGLLDEILTWGEEERKSRE